MPSPNDKIRSFIHDLRLYLRQLREEGQDFVIATDLDKNQAPAASGRKTGHERQPAAPARPRALSSRAPDAFRALEVNVKKCRACRLAEGRHHSVFGEGGMRKKVMFIGEGPGENEDLEGRPFVGRAGKLLDRILASIGLDRRDVFITNIVKCRPPHNRDPRPDEISACWKHLQGQIEILKPRAIVALGSPAAKTLLESDQGISHLRGRFHSYEGIPLLATFHPAFLLRAYTTENRKKVWGDMKMLKAFLEEGKSR